MPAQLICGDIRGLDPVELKAVLDDAGITRLDTAARYVNGESEKKLGRANLGASFVIDTKIMTDSPADGTLSPEAIETSLVNSLRALDVDKVNVLYCHAPDFSTPVPVQARAFDAQYKEGRFNHLGVSNFPPSMLAEWLDVAAQEGLLKPTVYQGQYNLLCRGYEETLFPLLRQHGISFNGYSPLAGGFLLGNLTAQGVQAGNRFAVQTPYLKWYDTPAMHAAVEKLSRIAKEVGIGMDELSLRWLVYHSILDGSDGAILGASKVSHIENNVAQLRKGPLDEKVVKELDGLWEGVKTDGLAIVSS